LAREAKIAKSILHMLIISPYDAIPPRLPASQQANITPLAAA
jgi:hypothetical protein